MYVTKEAFEPRVNDLHRTARLERKHAEMDVHTDVFAGTEGTADSGEVNADVFFGEAEAGGKLPKVAVEPLG